MNTDVDRERRESALRLTLKVGRNIGLAEALHTTNPGVGGDKIDEVVASSIAAASFFDSDVGCPAAAAVIREAVAKLAKTTGREHLLPTETAA